MLKRVLATAAFLVLASGAGQLKAACTVTAIRAADTGNIIGYVVTGDQGSIVVQNLSSAEAACGRVTRMPLQKT